MSQTKAQLINPLGTVSNLNVTGVSTVGVVTGATSIQATVFYGSGSGLTGVASTDNIQTATPANFLNNVTIGGDLTVNGTQTIINTQILDVADKTVGVASTSTKTALTQNGAGLVIYGPSDINFTYDRDKIAVGLNTNLSVTGVVTATSFSGSGANLTGVVTATSFSGSGANLTGISAGLELKQAGTSVGTAITQVNFASGATLTTASAGISTITISVGLTTEALTPSNSVATLNLSSAQDHKVTATGITTITCSGGTEGESHTVRIVNSGIATVGFSTFFLFPSGSAPSLPTTSGAIHLVSFTVHRVGAGGTQLLAGASVNFS